MFNITMMIAKNKTIMIHIYSRRKLYDVSRFSSSLWRAREAGGCGCCRSRVDVLWAARVVGGFCWRRLAGRVGCRRHSCAALINRLGGVGSGQAVPRARQVRRRRVLQSGLVIGSGGASRDVGSSRRMSGFRAVGSIGWHC